MFRPKRYVIELSAAMGLYAVLLMGANLTERALHPTGMLNLTINLAPMLGAFAAAYVIVRNLGQMDEMQRRIQFDAIVMSFVGTALITFGWGFAEGAGLPHLRAFAVWPIMSALWVLSLVFAQRRYR
jgi:hypothetical protein